MDMTRTVRIPAMVCQHCLSGVERRPQAVGGALAASGRIDETRRSRSGGNHQRVSWPATAAALCEKGYPRLTALRFLLRGFDGKPAAGPGDGREPGIASPGSRRYER